MTTRAGSTDATRCRDQSTSVQELEDASVEGSVRGIFATSNALRGLAPFVPMVQATHPRQRNDFRGG